MTPVIEEPTLKYSPLASMEDYNPSMTICGKAISPLLGGGISFFIA